MDNLLAGIRKGRINGINVPYKQMVKYRPKNCEVCVMAKHDKSPFHAKPNPPTEIMDEMHYDVSGPWPTKSLGGAEYNLVALDGSSSFNVCHVMTAKSKVTECLIATIEKWERYTGRKLKKLITYRGGEYYSAELWAYLRAKGIQHEFAPCKTPELNGKAENLNKLLGNMVRSMLFQYNLSNTLWGHAVAYASYLCNVSYRRRLDKTPYEMFKGTVPDVKNIRTFGCKCYAHLDPKERNKLNPKSLVGIYLGPELNGPGYQVLVSANGKGKNAYAVRTFRDIVTYESLKDCCGVHDVANMKWAGIIPLHDQRPVSARTEVANNGESSEPICTINQRLRDTRTPEGEPSNVGSNENNDGITGQPCDAPAGNRGDPSLSNPVNDRPVRVNNNMNEGAGLRDSANVNLPSGPPGSFEPCFDRMSCAFENPQSGKDTI